MEHQQLLDLILENRANLAEFKQAINEIHQSYKNWTLGGVVAVLAAAILAIPGVVVVHRHLHPIEHFIGEKGKQIERKNSELDILLAKARTVTDVLSERKEVPPTITSLDS